MTDKVHVSIPVFYVHPTERFQILSNPSNSFCGIRSKREGANCHQGQWTNKMKLKRVLTTLHVQILHEPPSGRRCAPQLCFMEIHS